MAPIIGITRFDPIVDYVVSVQRAGGEPRVLEPGIDRIEEVLSTIHGLVLAGGDDIDPARYGAVPHATTKVVPAARDRFEIELARQAMQTGLPLLGICRGQQVMNVAAGGTLIQDIPSVLDAALAHSRPTPLQAIAHDVWISRASRLWAVLRGQLGSGDICPVNSRHHQSIALVAGSFEVSAMSPDGVIEGIERPGAPFCLAVQWHPENFWRTGEFKALFEALVAASRDRREASGDSRE